MRRAIGFFLIHTALWTGLVLVVPGADGVDYSRLGDATTPWVRQFIVALLAVLVVQVGYITRQKMWGEVVCDRQRSTNSWLWLPPLLIAIAGVVSFLHDGVSEAPGSYWIGMSATMLLVGITEEVTFRGILVVQARREWGSERRALLMSSGLFGLFHLPNWLLGQDFAVTVRQVVVTAVVGAIFFALRRSSGTLIVCIALHAAYDWMLIQGSF